MLPEVPLCEYMTGAAFQIPLEMLSLFDGFKRDIHLDSPRDEPRCVRALSSIMVRESLTEIGGVTDVTLLRMTQTLDYVGVEHVMSSHS